MELEVALYLHRMKILCPIIFLILWFSIACDLKAQDSLKCGFNRQAFSNSYTQWYSEATQNQAPHSHLKRWTEKRDSVFVIPVVFHFIYPPNSPLDKAFIEKHMQQINADFNRLNSDSNRLRSRFKSRVGNPKIRFVLVDKDPKGLPSKGYTVRTSMKSFGIEPTQAYALTHQMKFDSCGGSNAWNTSKYLNIWVCDLTTPYGKKYWAGFATPPQNAPHWNPFYYADSMIDGVVLDKNTYLQNTRASTLTHELGHYFGLRHVSGDPPSQISGPDSKCEFDDSLFDTPRVLHQNYFTCDTSINSCIEDSVDQPDMLENFMDYTGDNCRNTFTKQQASLMQYCLITLRPGLCAFEIKSKIKLAEFLLDIYPNPNSGNLHIDFKDSFSNHYSYTIYDCLGRTVLEAKLVNPISIVNLEFLSSGLYELAILGNQSELLFRKTIYKD